VIIGRFKAQCRPESAEELAAAIAEIQAPSREIPGVIHFDVARSLTDPNTFLAVEVFEDRAALDRQNAQAEVANMLRLIDAGALTSDYEWTVWETFEPGQTNSYWNGRL
jgi:quinol monooxygenase YgiN